MYLSLSGNDFRLVGRQHFLSAPQAAVQTRGQLASNKSENSISRSHRTPHAMNDEHKRVGVIVRNNSGGADERAAQAKYITPEVE